MASILGPSAGQTDRVDDIGVEQQGAHADEDGCDSIGEGQRLGDIDGLRLRSASHLGVAELDALQRPPRGRRRAAAVGSG